MTDKLSNNTPLTRKEKRFIHNILDTEKVGESALRAGYSSPNYGSYLLRQDKIKTALQAAMEKRGISDSFLAKKLKEGFSATYPPKFSKEGAELQPEHPDYFTREKYLRDALDIRGDFAPQKHEIEHRQIVIVLTPEMIKGLVDAEVISVEEVKDIQLTSQLTSQQEGNDNTETSESKFLDRLHSE